jgi:hypothetical protein
MRVNYIAGVELSGNSIYHTVNPVRARQQTEIRARAYGFAGASRVRAQAQALGKEKLTARSVSGD